MSDRFWVVEEKRGGHIFASLVMGGEIGDYDLLVMSISGD